MPSATATPNSGDEIRRLIDQWVNALHDKDVTARTSSYSSDVLLFDVINPLQHRGLDALRSRLTA
jgi:ketosteroid isomerase-like protein